VVLVTLAVAAGPTSAAVPIIFDTDIGNDVDDVLALGMIHLALRARLTTLEKLALVVLIQHSNQMEAEGVGGRADVVRMTAAERGVRCSCHRVSAQKTLTGLRQQGVLRRVRRGLAIVWDILAALCADPVASTPAEAEGCSF
jgi:hypothetical protein